MHMLFITNILLVKMIDVDLFFAVRGAQQGEEVALEVGAEAGDVLSGVFADEKHLTDVGFGLRVAFEAVFVAGLFFADLAVLGWGDGVLVGQECERGWEEEGRGGTYPA